MPSTTPETLTAVQRAERLNLRQKSGQAAGPDQGLAPDAMTKKSKPTYLDRARATLASSLGQQRDATADLDPRRDADLSFAVLPIDQIEPYAHNPRSGANPRYEEIKESIRADGITNTLMVTRRSPEAKYTTYGGGNTRLRIAQELYAEGDQRFATLQVIVKDWPGDAQVIAAHLSENELRGDITFWEKARGIHQFKTEFEAEHGKPLTASELNKELKARGLNFGIKTLQNFAFTVEHLAPLGNWLRATEVNETLRPQVAALLELAAKLGQAAGVQQALQGALQTRATELDALAARNVELDPSEQIAVQLDSASLLSDLRAAVADALGLDAARLAAMQAALVADARITAQALREIEPAPALVPGPAVPATGPTAAPGLDLTRVAQRDHAPAALEPAPTQAPLAGMLAGVATPQMPPLPTAAAAAPEPVAQPSSEAGLLAAIREALSRINALVPLADVLLAVDGAPFGYVVDLPRRSLDVYEDSGAVPDPGLRRAVWRLLASLSGQCDVRLTRKLPPDQVAWSRLHEQGLEAFEQELLQRTGTHFAGVMPAIAMDDLPTILATPQLGEAVLQLLRCMDEMRRRYPQRALQRINPLFPPGEEA